MDLIMHRDGADIKQAGSLSLANAQHILCSGTWHLNVKFHHESAGELCFGIPFRAKSQVRHRLHERYRQRDSVSRISFSQDEHDLCLMFAVRQAVYE